MDRPSTDIRSTILELCAEDDYGSWELWWSITGNNKGVPISVLRRWFGDCIESLINENKIVSKTGGKLVAFSKDLLLQQITETQPNPAYDYWFGVPEAD